MTSYLKGFGSAMGATILLAGATMGTAPALASSGMENTECNTAANSQQENADHFSGPQSIANIQGEFSFTQSKPDSNEYIAKVFGSASKYLCGSQYSSEKGESATSADDWSIAVSGEVEHNFVASISELSEAGADVQIMGCSCSSNPSDGLATANAEVTGINMQTIIKQAQPADDANTVVFTSQDGYKVELPLFYVRHHNTLIAFSINGAELGESVGGTNQLWIGSTGGMYFARDIVSIVFETRQTPPPTPGLDTSESMPNVSIRSSSEVYAK